MPDLKISQLPVATTPLAGTELVPIVQGGTTDQTTVQAILTSAVPSGTANGVLYLNGSKVVTSGSGLVFDEANLGLGVTPSSWVSNRRVLQIGGAAAALALNGSSAISEVFANTIRDSGGTYRYFANGPASYVDFNNSSAGGWAWALAASGTAGNAISFTQAMTLDASGNLGIGTSSPSGKLDVRGASYIGTDANNSFFVDSTATLVRIGAAGRTAFSTSALAFITSDGTGALERMRLDASGNLGLGVAPSAWNTVGPAFQVGSASIIGNSNQAILSANYFFSSGNKYISNGFATQYAQTLGQHVWYTAPSGTAGNAISFTQAMTLDASGRLMIGTTSPIGTLTVAGQITISGSPGGLGGSVRYIGVGGTATDWFINVPAGGSHNFAINESTKVTFNSNGDYVFGNAAIATNATNGFLYVPSCAGTPTGTPTTYTGRVPIVVDTTNNKLYFYSGGAWRDAGP